MMRLSRDEAAVVMVLTGPPLAGVVVAGGQPRALLAVLVTVVVGLVLIAVLFGEWR